MTSPLQLSATAFYGNACVSAHAPPWLSEFDSDMTNQVTASGRVTAQLTSAKSRHWDAINALRKRMRPDTHAATKERLDREAGGVDLASRFVNLTVPQHKAKVIEILNELDRAAHAIVWRSPFDTAVAVGVARPSAAIAGQAPVPMLLVPSRAQTRSGLGGGV